jgi:hypothetical protein
LATQKLQEADLRLKSNEYGLKRTASTDRYTALKDAANRKYDMTAQRAGMGMGAFTALNSAGTTNKVADTMMNGATNTINAGLAGAAQGSQNTNAMINMGLVGLGTGFNAYNTFK